MVCVVCGKLCGFCILSACFKYFITYRWYIFADLKVQTLMCQFMKSRLVKLNKLFLFEKIYESYYMIIC